MGSDIAIGKPVCKLMAAWYGAHVHGSCDNCHRQDIRAAKTMMIFISFTNHCTGGLRCENTNTVNNNDDDDDDDDDDDGKKCSRLDTCKKSMMLEAILLLRNTPTSYSLNFHPYHNRSWHWS